jgi:hypothetical protein
MIKWAHENFHESFFEGPQKGINKNKTPLVTFNIFNTNLRYDFIP